MEKDEVQKLIDDALEPVLRKNEELEYRLNSHKHKRYDLTQELDFDEPWVKLVDEATIEINASSGKNFYIDAGGSRTLAAPTNPSNGKTIIIRHYANGADRTLTLTTTAGGFRYGASPTVLAATLSGTMDYIGCKWNEIDGYWDVVSYATGY